MPGLPQRLARLSASPAFQRFAFDFPLTRPVAKRRAGALFDLTAGFVHSQILAACVQLDLFQGLANRPQTLEQVASKAGLSPEAARRLLDAAVALRLLKRRRDGRYTLGRLGAPLSGPAGAGVAAMIAHHGGFYRDLADPVARLRHGPGGGELARFWPYAGADAPTRLPSQGVAPYTALMSASQDFVADDVLHAARALRARTWLDLGGGNGAFLAAAARRRPELVGAVVDLPGVAALARARFERLGLDERLDALGGDIRTVRLERPFDIVSLVRVLHDHDDEAALAILASARRALSPRGRLLIAEPLRGPGADSRISDAYFGPYLFVMGQGRMRTRRDLARLLCIAGFRTPWSPPTRRPFLTRLLVTGSR